MRSTKSSLTHLEAHLQDDASQDLLLQGELLLEELSLKDAYTAAKLIQLFTDKAERQDLLFSILQVLEAAPPGFLPTALLAETEALSAQPSLAGGHLSAGM